MTGRLRRNAAPPSGVISMAADEWWCACVLYYSSLCPGASINILLSVRRAAPAAYRYTVGKHCWFMYRRINTKYLPTLSSSRAECNVIIVGLCTVYSVHSVSAAGGLGNNSRSTVYRAIIFNIIYLWRRIPTRLHMGMVYGQRHCFIVSAAVHVSTVSGHCAVYVYASVSTAEEDDASFALNHRSDLRHRTVRDSTI